MLEAHFKELFTHSDHPFGFIIEMFLSFFAADTAAIRGDSVTPRLISSQVSVCPRSHSMCALHGWLCQIIALAVCALFIKTCISLEHARSTDTLYAELLTCPRVPWW